MVDNFYTSPFAGEDDEAPDSLVNRVLRETAQAAPPPAPTPAARVMGGRSAAPVTPAFDLPAFLKSLTVRDPNKPSAFTALAGLSDRLDRPLFVPGGQVGEAIKAVDAATPAPLDAQLLRRAGTVANEVAPTLPADIGGTSTTGFHPFEPDRRNRPKPANPIEAGLDTFQSRLEDLAGHPVRVADAVSNIARGKPIDAAANAPDGGVPARLTGVMEILRVLADSSPHLLAINTVGPAVTDQLRGLGVDTGTATVIGEVAQAIAPGGLKDVVKRAGTDILQNPSMAHRIGGALTLLGTTSGAGIAGAQALTRGASPIETAGDILTGANVGSLGGSVVGGVASRSLSAADRLAQSYARRAAPVGIVSGTTAPSGAFDSNALPEADLTNLRAVHNDVQGQPLPKGQNLFDAAVKGPQPPDTQGAELYPGYPEGTIRASVRQVFDAAAREGRWPTTQELQKVPGVIGSANKDAFKGEASQAEHLLKLALDGDQFWYRKGAQALTDIGRGPDGTTDPRLAAELIVAMGRTGQGIRPTINLRSALAFIRTRQALQDTTLPGGGTAFDRLLDAPPDVARQMLYNEYIRNGGPGYPSLGKAVVPAMLDLYKTGRTQIAGNMKLANYTGAYWDALNNQVDTLSVPDRWHFRAHGSTNPEAALKEPKASQAVVAIDNEIARRLGWSPEQFQAAVWGGIMLQMEGKAKLEQGGWENVLKQEKPAVDAFKQAVQTGQIKPYDFPVAPPQVVYHGQAGPKQSPLIENFSSDAPTREAGRQALLGQAREVSVSSPYQPGDSQLAAMGATAPKVNPKALESLHRQWVMEDQGFKDGQLSWLRELGIPHQAVPVRTGNYEWTDAQGVRHAEPQVNLRVRLPISNDDQAQALAAVAGYTGAQNSVGLYRPVFDPKAPDTVIAVRNPTGGEWTAAELAKQRWVKRVPGYDVSSNGSWLLFPDYGSEGKPFMDRLATQLLKAGVPQQDIFKAKAEYREVTREQYGPLIRQFAATLDPARRSALQRTLDNQLAATVLRLQRLGSKFPADWRQRYDAANGVTGPLDVAAPRQLPRMVADAGSAGRVGGVQGAVRGSPPRPGGEALGSGDRGLAGAAGSPGEAGGRDRASTGIVASPPIPGAAPQLAAPPAGPAPTRVEPPGVGTMLRENFSPQAVKETLAYGLGTPQGRQDAKGILLGPQGLTRDGRVDTKRLAAQAIGAGLGGYLGYSQSPEEDQKKRIMRGLAGASLGAAAGNAAYNGSGQAAKLLSGNGFDSRLNLVATTPEGKQAHDSLVKLLVDQGIPAPAARKQADAIQEALFKQGKLPAQFIAQPPAPTSAANASQPRLLTTQADLDAALKERNESALAKAGKTIQGYRYNNLLSGVTGGLVDTGSNLLNVFLLEPVRIAGGAAIEGAAQKAGRLKASERATVARELPAEFKGAGAGLLEGLGQAAHVMAEGGNPIRTEQSGGLIKGKLGAPLELGTRLRVAADVLVDRIGQNAAANMLAVREAERQGLKPGSLAYNRTVDATRTGILGVLRRGSTIGGDIRQGGVAPFKQGGTDLEDLAREAQGIAARMIFQQEEGATTKVIGGARGDRYLGWFIPFFKTQANIASEGVTMTPGVGAAGIALDLARGAKLGPKLGGAYAGNEGSVLTRSNTSAVLPASQRIAEQTFGIMLAAGAGALVAQGIMTDGGPGDPDELKALKSTGWQPYALHIGGRYYPVTQVMGGMSLPIMFGAALWGDFVRHGEKPSPAMIADFAQHMREGWFDQAGLRAFSELIDNVTGRGDPGAKWLQAQKFAADQAGTLLPYSGLVREISRYTDPYQRQAQGILDMIKEGYGFSRDLQPRVGNTGKPLPRNVGVLRSTGEVDPDQGLRRYYGSKSPQMDVQISRAISRVQDWQAHPDQYPQPSRQEFILANTYGDSENDDYTYMKQYVASQNRRQTLPRRQLFRDL